MIFSTGQWYKKVPRDPLANLQFRRKLVIEASKSKAVQQGLIEICKNDLIFYANTFVYQYNPLLKGLNQYGPWITYPYQERAVLERPPVGKGILWCYENNRTGLWEKSRDMGLSGWFLIIEGWLTKFHGAKCMNVSRNADAVDSKSPDSLFWKIRFINENLPNWLKGEILTEKMYFGYNRSRGTINGEASTKDFGTGGRGSVVFVDEFSKIKEDTAVRRGTASTSDCRFFNGTHEGTSTEFFRMTQEPEIIQLQFHWTQHPRKNEQLYSFDQEAGKLRFWKYLEATDEIVEIIAPEKPFAPDFKFNMTGAPTGGPHPGIRSPWYDQKCVDIGDARGVAMELDIDPKGSVSQFFDGIRIAALKAKWCRPPDWQGQLLHDSDGFPIRLDPQPMGLVKLWCKLDSLGRPRPSRYGAGCDVSAGTGATPSCLSIVDGETGEKVLEYADAYIDAKDFAAFVVAMCRLFANDKGEGAVLAWEHHGPGVTFGRTVWDALGYRNIYKPDDEDKIGGKTTKTPGFKPSGVAKPTLLREYKRALCDGLFLNPSELAIEECLMFKYDVRGGIVNSTETSDDPELARENHADRVIADALAWKMVKDVTQSQKQMEPPGPAILSFEWRRQMHKRAQREQEAWA